MHLDEVDIHEEWLVALRMLTDVCDRIIGLPNIERRQGVVIDSADIPGRLAGHTFPLAEVHDAVVHFVKLRIEGWEPRMKILGRIIVGIDAGVIGGEVLHLVEAVLDGIGLRLVAHMPFAGEIGRVAVLLEEFGNRRRFLLQSVLVTRGNHNRERRPDWNTSGQEGGRGLPCSSPARTSR